MRSTLSFRTSTPFLTKKTAEQEAAKLALEVSIELSFLKLRTEFGPEF
jgi:hypothetical protein